GGNAEYRMRNEPTAAQGAPAPRPDSVFRILYSLLPVAAVPAPPARKSDSLATAASLDARSAVRTIPFWTLTLGAGLEQLAVMVVWTHQVAFVVDRGVEPVVAASIA